MRIQGKQLAINTIEQNQLNLAIPVEPSDATRKDYVDSLINNSLSVERVSKENQNMIGSYSTGVTYIACDVPVLEDTIYKSVVSVYVNGLIINCGANYECFFSPDNILVRLVDDIRIGDRLYWNTDYADYDIDSDDSIDFKYLTNDSKISTVTLDTNETAIITGDDEIVSLKFTGGLNETATLTITGISFTIGDVSGSFTFDIGNTNGYLHTFTYIGENYYFTANSNPYNIIWNGTNSIIFSVIKNYPFDINRYAGPTLYPTSTNANEPILSLTDTFMTVGSNTTSLYLYEKVNSLWTNKQTINTLSNILYFTKMTDDYILAADRDGNFEVHKWSGGTSTWDSGTTIQVSGTGGYEIYGDISSDQIITGDGRYNSNVGLVKIYTENTGYTWDSTTLYNPVGADRVGGAGVFIEKNTKAVVGTYYHNRIYVYDYISGTSWGIGTELDRLSGDCTDVDTTSTSNVVLDYKDNLILAGAYNTTYSGTTSGVAYIYEYSGGTWWINQLPFPSGDTTNLKLGSSGKIVTYEGNTGTTYETGQTYLYVGTKTTTNSIGKIFIYKQSGSTWELYGQTDKGYCDVAFDVDSQLNVITSSTNNIYYLSFHGHQIFNPTSRNKIPVATNLAINGTKTIGEYVTLTYDYSHSLYVSEDTNNTQITWYSRTYLSENYVERTDLTNNKTPYVDSDLYGKHVQVYLAPVDDNGNMGSLINHSETLIEADNTDFNSYTPISSQSLLLTIISGNPINGNGVGVYVLLGTHNIKQNATTSSWGIGFNSGGHNIYIYGTSGGYNSMSLTINGGNTYTNFTDTTQTGYVSDSLFTQYTLGGTVFTIGKNTGWR